MPSRIHWSGKNNRSQHNLVGSTVAEDPVSSVPASAAGANPPSVAGAGAGAANPPSASPNPAFSSSESFQPDTTAGRGNHAQQPPPPPPHLANIYGTTSTAAGANPATIPPQLQHSNSVSAAFDSRQREQQEFADQVTRSQSYRYTQPSPTTTQQLLLQQQHQQQQQQQHLHQQQQHQQQQQTQSSPGPSVEDLTSSPGHPSIVSPILAAAPPPLYTQQQPQAQPPKPKQSTRRLIKNILNPRGQDFPPQSQNNQFGNSVGPARRNSKRVSLPPPYPPSIRTGVSQVSLDQQQQLEWQNQGPPSQPSPLQGVGDFHEPYVIEDSDQALRPQNSQENQHPTIRPVPSSDQETAPYPTEDTGYRQHRGHVPSQSQVPPELQHQQQYSQAVFEGGPHQQQQQQQQPQQYQFPNQHQQQQQPQQPQQYQAGNQQAFSSHLVANPQQPNPETVSQLSHESPITDSDQPAANSIPAPAVQTSTAINYPQQTQDNPGRQNPPPAVQAQTPQTMAPPPGAPPPARRSQEAEKAQPPPGPPPSYRQSQQPPGMNPLPQPPNAGPPNPNFRASNVPDRQQFEGQEPQGRNSPQPTSDRGGEDPEKAFKDLLTKYKNVKRLYFDGKKEIEQLNGQVEQLQNAIANQRMSQSRTSLDDSEYATRFNRLNGAINNLSFNIRKDWSSVPAWLVPFVSVDALKTGKQEMTAIGRAVITRWIVDEIFNRCFHPGLDPELSRQLKGIELNIRHFSYTMNSQEEFDALTSKVVSWRMATLEGLKDVLSSPESVEHRNDFTRRATTNLTASLFQHLADPPPAGVDGSASMIVELAVGIASNMPLESRDVAIVYPLPEQPIQLELMDVEKTGLPALEARPSDASEEGAADDGSGAAAGAGGKEGANKDGAKDRRGDKRTAPPPPKDSGKVRFAGFVAVEVRGRQVLVKAPVWTLG